MGDGGGCGMNGFGYRHSRSGEKGRGSPAAPAVGSVMGGTFMVAPLLCCCCCAADNTAANRWIDS